MLVGYARVSTADQNLDHQVDALKKVGCEKVYQDKVTGATSERPGLDEALRFLREGDVLVVWKLDRFGRTVRGLIELVDHLQGRGIGFRSASDAIDTSSAQGRFFFHVVGAFAELERDLIRERTHAGLMAARARGRCGGRPRLMTSTKHESAAMLLAGGMAPKDVAASIGLSVQTVYRHFPGGRVGSDERKSERQAAVA